MIGDMIQLKKMGFNTVGIVSEVMKYDTIRIIDGVSGWANSLIPQRLGAAIYTQTTDVEGEVNGLVTYDRKVVKIPVYTLHAVHDRRYLFKGKNDLQVKAVSANRKVDFDFGLRAF